MAGLGTAASMAFLYLGLAEHNTFSDLCSQQAPALSPGLQYSQAQQDAAA